MKDKIQIAAAVLGSLSVVTLCLMVEPSAENHQRREDVLRNIDAEIIAKSDTNHFQWRGDRAFHRESIELPRELFVDAPPEEECTGCTNTQPPVEREITWRISWTVPATSATNRPAEFTGLCSLPLVGDTVTELTVHPVKYKYLPRDVRTNALKQTYQTWMLDTNDMAYSDTVTTTSATGRIGPYTK